MINVFVVLYTDCFGGAYVVGAYSTKKLAQEAARREVKLLNMRYDCVFYDYLETRNYIRCLVNGEGIASCEINKCALTARKEA